MPLKMLRATSYGKSQPHASFYFQLDTTGASDQLVLDFTGGITDAGGTLTPTSSYEYESVAGDRIVESGAVAAPEPASWALGFIAIGAAFYIRRRALRA